MPTPCPHFRPSTTAPWICKWWELEEDTGEYFCSRPAWDEVICDTRGRNPYETEEDSYQ